MLNEGDRVRFSEAGRAKVRSMPEAWGLHRALYGDEVGEVLECLPPEEDLPARVSVEFPGGGAYHWDVDCFERLESPDRGEESAGGSNDGGAVTDRQELA
jgi:hypothetical protein